MDSDSYEKQRKQRWVIEVPKRRKGKVKTGETNGLGIKSLSEKRF